MKFYHLYNIPAVQKIIDRYFYSILDSVDYTATEWRARFYRNLETDFEKRNLLCISHEGKTLGDVIKEGLKWKSGDLRNGWQSIGVSDWTIQESDLKLQLTPEWVGLKIYKKGSEKIFIV